MRSRLIFVALGVGAAALAGYFLYFRIISFGPANNKLQVTTSFYPLYFFTSQIAGDRAVVYNVTPAGAEPHDYEPTPQDIARIEDSKLLVLNGGKFEAWGDKMKDSLNGQSTIVITVGEALVNPEVSGDNSLIHDPHVWLDPILAKREAETIAQELEQIDPDNASYYDGNLRELESKLDDLDAKFQQGLSSCQKKDIITSHAAFAYLAREYGLRQVAISGFSPDEEPSAQQLVKVADFAKSNNVDYIFFESLVSPKLSETIAREAGVKTMVLNPLEGLTDAEIAQGKNYFTEMENNLTNLKLALQCN